MPLHDTYNLSTWVFFFIHLHTVTAHCKHLTKVTIFLNLSSSYLVSDIFAHLLVNDTLTGEFQYVRYELTLRTTFLLSHTEVQECNR